MKDHESRDLDPRDPRNQKKEEPKKPLQMTLDREAKMLAEIGLLDETSKTSTKPEVIDSDLAAVACAAFPKSTLGDAKAKQREVAEDNPDMHVNMWPKGREYPAASWDRHTRNMKTLARSPRLTLGHSEYFQYQASVGPDATSEVPNRRALGRYARAQVNTILTEQGCTSRNLIKSGDSMTEAYRVIRKFALELESIEQLKKGKTRLDCAPEFTSDGTLLLNGEVQTTYQRHGHPCLRHRKDDRYVYTRVDQIIEVITKLNEYMRNK